MVKNLILSISLWVLFLFLVGCQQIAGSTSGGQVNIEKDKQAIMQLFEDNVHGLLNRDVEGLLSLVADDRVVVEDGQIMHPTRNETGKDLQVQFKAGKYTSVTVLTPPIITVSSDGKMAWCVSQARLKYVGDAFDGEIGEMEFIDAALSVFEKRNSKWVEVASAESLGTVPEE